MSRSEGVVVDGEVWLRGCPSCVTSLSINGYSHLGSGAGGELWRRPPCYSDLETEGERGRGDERGREGERRCVFAYLRLEVGEGDGDRCSVEM